MFPTEGKYEIPVISCERYSKREWIGFPMAGSCKGEHRKGKGIHFFVDDYQFIRLWNQIDRYLPMLASYGWMMSPDFSLYTDFPVSLQIYNHFRKHWLGAYLQRNGIHVIPTIGWSHPDSYKWCFDGEPKGSCVAVSAIGCGKNPEARKWFLAGYQEMRKGLEPEKIIFYGKVPDGCQGNIVEIAPFQERFRRLG